MEEQQKTVTIGERLQVVAGGTALSAIVGVGSLFFHSFPGEQVLLFAPLIISIVNGKPIYEAIQEFRTYLAPQMSKEQFNEIVQKHVQEDNSHLDQSTSAKFKRILSLFSSDAEDGDVKEEKRTFLKERTTAKRNVFSGVKKSKFATLEQFDDTPKGSIFIEQDEDEMVYLKLKSAYHILIAAKTGGGKTELAKRIMMQLVDTCAVYFIHPMYAQVEDVEDERKVSVWTPIEDRLMDIYEGTEHDPLKVAKKKKDMLFLLSQFEDLLNKRAKEKETAKKMGWARAYLVIDEGPMVISTCGEEAKRIIGRIVREGRQLQVYLMLITQSSQVQTIGINEPELAQFVTKFYLGGDSRTRNKMMPSLKDMQENLFNKPGTVAFASPEYTDPKILHMTLLTNEVIHGYFGEEFIEEEYSEWFDYEQSSEKTSPFLFSRFEENDAEDVSETEDDIYDEEQEIRNAIEDDILDAIETIIAQGKTESNINQISTVIKGRNPDTRYNQGNAMDTQLVKEIAKDKGLEIVRGAGGRNARKGGLR